MKPSFTDTLASRGNPLWWTVQMSNGTENVLLCFPQGGLRKLFFGYLSFFMKAVNYIFDSSLLSDWIERGCFNS